MRDTSEWKGDAGQCFNAPEAGLVGARMILDECSVTATEYTVLVTGGRELSERAKKQCAEIMHPGVLMELFWAHNSHML